MCNGELFKRLGSDDLKDKSALKKAVGVMYFGLAENATSLAQFEDTEIGTIRWSHCGQRRVLLIRAYQLLHWLAEKQKMNSAQQTFQANGKTFAHSCLGQSWLAAATLQDLQQYLNDTDSSGVGDVPKVCP